MRNLNKNEKRRLEILAPYLKTPIPEQYDILHFESLPLDVLQTLTEENFLDVTETQNDSPTIDEFMTFMQNHPEFTAHGYIVSLKREDYRVSIERLSSAQDLDKKTIISFVDFARHADEFDLDPARCW